MGIIMERDRESTDIQEKILDMIRIRKLVRSREFIRDLNGWDFRKAITRLRRKGYPIENLRPPGVEGIYVWTEGMTHEELEVLASVAEGTNRLSSVPILRDQLRRSSTNKIS